MSRSIPDHINKLISEQVPELCIQFVSPLGWQWTFRCTESEQYFAEWEEALVNFLATEVNANDSQVGVFDE